MTVGPITIFDKSFLQGLSLDEAVWFDAFFRSNITPLFFAETLADLEKEVPGGRTPEEVVGDIALKTPVIGALPNIHHGHLCIANLMGEKVALNRVPAIASGRMVEVDGQTGMVVEQQPETNALQRWQKREFLEIERDMAKTWRQALDELNFEDARPLVQRLWGGRMEASDLPDAKKLADQMVGGTGNTYQVLKAALEFFDVPKDLWEAIGKRWSMMGKPPLPTFAPYAAHVLTVDLFNFLALASDLKSIGRASSRIDIAYLYYLPFCMVFVSSDRLHKAVVPLFLGDNQEFVWGHDLKEDLAKIDAHFSSFPEEVREQGVMKFATEPPRDGDCLTANIWDRYLPSWRVKSRDRSEEIPNLSDEIRERIKQISEAPTTHGLKKTVNPADIDSTVIKRLVPMKKGKWRLLPPGVEEADQDRE